MDYFGAHFEQVLALGFAFALLILAKHLIEEFRIAFRRGADRRFRAMMRELPGWMMPLEEPALFGVQVAALSDGRAPPVAYGRLAGRRRRT